MGCMGGSCVVEREEYFWQIPIPQILKLRPLVRPFLSFKIGTGNQIFLWYDSWYPAGCFIGKYGFKTLYDVGHNIGPNQFSIIKKWRMSLEVCLIG